MAKERKRVLIATGWYDYRLHRGMEQYAIQQNWRLTTNLTRGRVIPWGWEGDGILAWLSAGDDLAEFVQQAKKPTVDFSFFRPNLKYPRVLEDHAHAAELVAEHFLSRGFEHFIFYSEESNWAYEERGAGFVKALKRSGRSCNWIRWHQSPEFRAGRGLDQWRRQRQWLINQLKQSPKPVGVFAANDEHALDVLESCENAGIAVPEAVAIVGADNYLLAPGAMQTPISSVDTNLEVLGYRGAALLDELMKGRKPPEAPIRVPASGVVTRKSSDLLAVNHKGVANSLRFILEHFHEPINLSDLVAAAAMSRRGLHKAFMEHLGRTPGQELQRLRIERARRLLSGTDHKMEDLAIMCGYQSANSLYVAFRQATGVSPAEFRKSAGGAQPASSRNRKTSVVN